MQPCRRARFTTELLRSSAQRHSMVTPMMALYHRAHLDPINMTELSLGTCPNLVELELLGPALQTLDLKCVIYVRISPTHSVYALDTTTHH